MTVDQLRFAVSTDDINPSDQLPNQDVGAYDNINQTSPQDMEDLPSSFNMYQDKGMEEFHGIVSLEGSRPFFSQITAMLSS
ncbi:hypothetical protein N7454_010240 [Penicillium verhagenii]|nr:hypothetical protein N7454_010240 [Penicillium verhagenii]